MTEASQVRRLCGRNGQTQDPVRGAPEPRDRGPGRAAGEGLAKAAAELAQANQQDPRVLYHLARAYQGKGDTKLARLAAEHNSLNFNYAYVRGKAKQLLGQL